MIGRVRMKGKNVGGWIAVAATIVAAVSLCVSVGSYATARTVATTTSHRKLPVYSVERPDKAIAISFDCAWGAEYTDTILSHLEANEIRCTFFAVEFWVK